MRYLRLVSGKVTTSVTGNGWRSYSSKHFLESGDEGTSPTIANTAEIVRFSTVRSPPIPVSCYCTKWQFQGWFPIARYWTSRLRQQNPILTVTSIPSDTRVQCTCRGINCAHIKWEFAGKLNFDHGFNSPRGHGDNRAYQRKWRSIRTSANADGYVINSDISLPARSTHSLELQLQRNRTRSYIEVLVALPLQRARSIYGASSAECSTL